MCMAITIKDNEIVNPILQTLKLMKFKFNILNCKIFIKLCLRLFNEELYNHIICSKLIKY